MAVIRRAPHEFKIACLQVISFNDDRFCQVKLELIGRCCTQVKHIFAEIHSV